MSKAAGSRGQARLHVSVVRNKYIYWKLKTRL